MNLVWFKRDLRLSDHAPLYEASKSGPILCLYIFEPDLISAEDFDSAHLEFITKSLVELDSKLKERGGHMVFRTGDAVEVLDNICRQQDISTVWAHEETTNSIGYARDRRVRRWASETGRDLRELPQNGVIRRLKSRDGWAKRWKERMESPPLPAPDSIRFLPVKFRGELPDPSDFSLHSFAREDRQPAGESAARQTLRSFLDRRSVNYRKAMSSPNEAEESCSRLSPYIAYGNISIRSVHHELIRKQKELKTAKADGREIPKTWLPSLSSFAGRLRWHCHFIQKLEDEPGIEFFNVNRGFNGLRENEFNQDYFEAWKSGRTGYPLIDACMRALHATGWINFRMRAMLMSFAAYHLWLHWRQPALHLAKLFVDYEPGIHYSQCQMQSGVTGINTVRIYSPIKQAIDQDPQGHFIRRFVPELADLPDHLIPEPHKMTLMEQQFYSCKIDSDYPAPIVDHQTAYREARDRIHAAKRSSVVREEAAKVYQKHGSRKQSFRQRMS